MKGGNKLKGEVYISGSKNSAVALIPAALLIEGECIIENVPYIKDVIVLQNILNQIGAKMEFIDDNTVKIDSSGVSTFIADHSIIKEMRASYYLMGALLGRFNRAEVPFPGGCNFGSRPIDQHLKAFEALGADVQLEGGIVKMRAEKLVGAQIYLDMASVGATINVILAAVRAEGTTIIENAAKEPHVVDLANFLNAMGAEVKGAGTDMIRINGVKKLSGGKSYSTIPDQIEAGTYMIAAAATCGDVTVKNVIPKHMEALTAKLIEMKVTVDEGEDSIRVIGNPVMKKVNIKTFPYPGFPTDLHPQMSILLGMVNGTSTITEGIFEGRFQYADELKKMGASIISEGRIAFIDGPWRLSGAPVKATDLRAGVTMVIAGLIADGVTEISQIKYIDRGYENLVEKFKALGADIERVEKED